MKALILFSMALLLTFWQVSQAKTPSEDMPSEKELMGQEQAYQQWAKEFVRSLNHQTGVISLPNGIATLTVPEDFYYLSPEDTERVLVDAWGNPPGTATLGMLFPAHVTPLDDESWGVTIEYEQDGYVSDDDANDIDYNDLLEQMQEDTRDANTDRVKAGYPAVELIGWAAAPHYDEASHKLYWAKEVKFGEDPSHTLNYNIRALGRQGVLVMNFIASMDQLHEIETNLNTVLNMAEFDEGHRYADFNPDIDQVAAYGLGALVAGKVVAKTGILAAVLLFLKKFGVFIVVGIVAFGRKLFGKKNA